MQDDIKITPPENPMADDFVSKQEPQQLTINDLQRWDVLYAQQEALLKQMAEALEPFEPERITKRINGLYQLTVQEVIKLGQAAEALAAYKGRG